MQKKSANQTQRDWYPAEIKCALEIKEKTLRDLSRENGLHPDTLKAALRVPYPKAEKIIAEALGMRPEEIWPLRYAKRNTQIYIAPQTINA